MTPDQPAAPAGLHPETAVICAGRPGHAGGGPLNVPVVLASNFHAREPGTGEDSRAYVPPGLLRLSVGCEHIDDLWNDLSSALPR